MEKYPGNPEVKPFLKADSVEIGDTLAIQVNNMGRGTFSMTELEGVVTEVSNEWINVVPHGGDQTQTYTIQLSSAGVGMCYYNEMLIGSVNSVHKN